MAGLVGYLPGNPTEQGRTPTQQIVRRFHKGIVTETFCCPGRSARESVDLASLVAWFFCGVILSEDVA